MKAQNNNTKYKLLKSTVYHQYKLHNAGNACNGKAWTLPDNSLFPIMFKIKENTYLYTILQRPKVMDDYEPK